jgi:cell division protein FtsW
MLQPDMGTAIIVVLLAIGMYFMAGVDIKQLLWLIPIFIIGALITAQSATYRLHRLRVLFDSDLDPLGIGYHVRQVMIAMQNGGMLGLGLGASKQKYGFLPEAHTDSIFAILVEETGFIGGLGLIFLYALFMYYLYRVVAQTKDRFGFMLASGVLIFFGLQSVLNLAAMTKLAPLTGVPLPFISNGGTNLLMSYVMMGIAISINRFSNNTQRI